MNPVKAPSRKSASLSRVGVLVLAAILAAVTFACSTERAAAPVLMDGTELRATQRVQSYLIKKDGQVLRYDSTRAVRSTIVEGIATPDEEANSTSADSTSTAPIWVPRGYTGRGLPAVIQIRTNRGPVVFRVERIAPNKKGLPTVGSGLCIGARSSWLCNTVGPKRTAAG